MTERHTRRLPQWFVEELEAVNNRDLTQYVLSTRCSGQIGRKDPQDPAFTLKISPRPH